MPKCDFNKALRHRCSPVNLLSEHLFLRTPLGDCFRKFFKTTRPVAVEVVRFAKTKLYVLR